MESLALQACIGVWNYVSGCRLNQSTSDALPIKLCNTYEKQYKTKNWKVTSRLNRKMFGYFYYKSSKYTKIIFSIRKK